jgi:hypothetical protein
MRGGNVISDPLTPNQATHSSKFSALCKEIMIYPQVFIASVAVKDNDVCFIEATDGRRVDNHLLMYSTKYFLSLLVV